MPETDRNRPLVPLGQMPQRMRERARRFGAELARRRSVDGGFSLLEHVWHLAELEREGFGLRIRRLREESDPDLADFDGAAIASARRYDLRDLEAGLEAFEVARAENLVTLSRLSGDDRLRSGRQAGVGPVTLGDIPRLMAAHDAAHDLELDALRAEHLRESLSRTPARLAAALGKVTLDRLRRRPATPPVGVEALSAIGHARHLGDIETEGYQVRIRRLREETSPRLESLDGERLAQDRRYEDAEPSLALRAFSEARAQTIETLRAVRPEEWSRAGLFEGYGPITLLGLLEIMDAHDAGHLLALEQRSA